MLKCQDVLARGSAYLDGEIGLGERLSVKSHLLICRHCRAYLQKLSLTVATVAELSPPEVGDDVVGRVLERLGQAGPPDGRG